MTMQALTATAPAGASMPARRAAQPHLTLCHPCRRTPPSCLRPMGTGDSGSGNIGGSIGGNSSGKGGGRGLSGICSWRQQWQLAADSGGSTVCNSSAGGSISVSGSGIPSQAEPPEVLPAIRSMLWEYSMVAWPLLLLPLCVLCLPARLAVPAVPATAVMLALSLWLGCKRLAAAVQRVGAAVEAAIEHRMCLATFPTDPPSWVMVELYDAIYSIKSPYRLQQDVAQMRIHHMQLSALLGRLLSLLVMYVALVWAPLRIASAAACSAGFTAPAHVSPVFAWAPLVGLGGMMLFLLRNRMKIGREMTSLMSYQQHVQQQRGGGTSTASSGS